MAFGAVMTRRAGGAASVESWYTPRQPHRVLSFVYFIIPDPVFAARALCWNDEKARGHVFNRAGSVGASDNA